MRSSGGFAFSFRKALSHLGLSKPAITRVLTTVVPRFEANWTRELVNHMFQYKAG